MINFRYHVVSITSVFLALAIGLVLGTAALNGPVADDLKKRVTDLRAANNQLRGDVQSLQKQVAGREDFVKEIAPSLVSAKLTGRKVLIVVAPGAAAAQRDHVLAMLKTADATVTGTITLTDAFLDPAHNDELVDLANKTLPLGVTKLPANNDGAETSAALFGKIFAVGQASVPDTSRISVLAAYNQSKFIQSTTDVTSADALIVIGGPPPSGNDADRRSKGLLAAVTQLAKSFEHTVVAAPTASGVIASLRGDGTFKMVSTVDTVESTEGELATVLATVEQFAGGAGHYGSGPGASTAVPKLTR